MGLAFFERVFVRNCASNPSLNGRSGVILGIGDEPGQPISYGVMLDGDDEITCFDVGEVEGTGEILDRSLFYDDKPPVRVRVTPDGRGEIVDPEKS